MNYYWSDSVYYHIKRKGGKVSNQELYKLFSEATPEEIKEGWLEWFSIPEKERETLKGYAG